MFIVVGEALADHGYTQQAARWFTSGLVTHLGPLTDVDMDDLIEDFDAELLARGRLQARQGLGLPQDHIDTLVQELQQEDAAAAAGA